jgi:hypothetical protein
MINANIRANLRMIKKSGLKAALIYWRKLEDPRVKELFNLESVIAFRP